MSAIIPISLSSQPQEPQGGGDEELPEVITGYTGTAEWTTITPSEDSRLIYVATDGDDSAAEAVYDRGYYLPSDPEIGDDPTNPIGPIKAYSTLSLGSSKVTGASSLRYAPRSSCADWILFRRGQEFYLNDNETGWKTHFVENIWNIQGRSEQESFVVTAWGPLSEQRPILSGETVQVAKTNIKWISLTFRDGIRIANGYDWLAGFENVLFEDCLFEGGGIGLPSTDFWNNINFRRCVIVDSFNPNGHNQGMYIASAVHPITGEIGYGKLTVEECVFDRNGYKEDPNEPTTWTRGINVNGLAVGTGVQPKRTYFDRNIYAAMHGDFSLRGNIISRGGGGASVQMRVGGVAERNLFLFCQQSISMGNGESFENWWNYGVMKDNVVLHDDLFLPPGGYGLGISLGGYERDFAITNNTMSHFHRWSNSAASLIVSGKPSSAKSRAAFLRSALVRGNVIDHRHGAKGIYIDGYYDPSKQYGISSLNLDDNQVRTVKDVSLGNNGFWGKPYQIDYRDTPNRFIEVGGSSGNAFCSDTSVFSADRDQETKLTRGFYSFEQHQEKGYDLESSFTSDQESFELANGWTDSDRDIVSYMQSVDPDYVVNENVYVDEGTSGTKQSPRQKVWEVVAENSTDESIIGWAKLCARRQDAFNNFISKARGNRKGNWDSRWTAEAVNNYIRDGYGKVGLTGPYDNRDAKTIMKEDHGVSLELQWTDFSKYLDPDSRIMYVSNEGNDSSAVSYSPSSSEIGSDPMQPTGTVQAFATYEAARALVRNNKADWILFRRGDTFILENGLFSHGTHMFFVHSDAEDRIRNVFGAYGSESEARPIITTTESNIKSLIQGFAVDADNEGNTYENGNIAFVSLNLRAPGVGSSDSGCIAISGIGNILFEDCRIRGGNSISPYNVFGTSEIRYPKNIVFRRCSIVDACRSEGGHVQGLFVSGVKGIAIEECVLDRNGYVEDPTNPSTWSAKLKTSNQNTDPTIVGEGVQPHRTWFSRNIYASTYTDMLLRGCILSRSGSSHQMRVGGVAERNVFLWNDSAFSGIVQNGRDPWLSDQKISSNLVLHDDHLLAAAKNAAGIDASVGEGFVMTVEDNIVAHFSRPAKGLYTFHGLQAYSTHPAEIADKATFQRNIGLADSGIGVQLRGTTGSWGVSGVGSYLIGGNVIGMLESGKAVETTEFSKPSTWNEPTDNKYLNSSFDIGIPNSRSTKTHTEWKALGFDKGSSHYTTIESLASSTKEGWMPEPDEQGRRGWERDIVSYMEKIDSEYVVDENVTVDDGVPVENRRVDAPKVWEVLAGLHSASNSGTMTEEKAKLTARRYHAFLAFIEKARENRKGSWDVKYTADALNNYIREGFDKSTLEGLYTKSLARNDYDFENDPVDIIDESETGEGLE